MLLHCLLFICSFLGQGNDSLVEAAQRNLSLYIDRNNSLAGYYSLDTAGISMYASAADKASRKTECRIYWNELSRFRYLLKTLPYDSLLAVYKNKGNSRWDFPFVPVVTRFSADTSRVLKGMKIAIDPGHIAGDMELGKVEYKYLRLKKDSLNGIEEPIELIEGNLTLATAYFLKEKLEQQGAEVMLTREKPGQSAFGISYDEWLKGATAKTFEEAYKRKEITLEEKNRLVKKMNRRDIFQTYFRFADMRQRALKINNYHPDLTLVVHYNVNEKNIPWTKTTPKNYCMAFAGGNIKDEYFDKPENRLELLRLIVSNDLVSSVQLGGLVTAHFAEELKVPLARKNDAEYLREECLETHREGVFIRNLALTRLIHGPLVYGESLYQDNTEEAKRLANCTLEVGEIRTSERVKQVADCYYKAVLEYVNAASPK